MTTNTEAVKVILKDTLKKSTKKPGVLSYPKVLAFKITLEACKSVNEVIKCLNKNHDTIVKISGLSEADFNDCISQLKELKTKLRGKECLKKGSMWLVKYGIKEEENGLL